jgi:hypothetical protein
VSDIVSAIAGVVVAAAAAATAFFAWRGVHAWRYQLKGQAEYELARAALSAAYRVRDAFNQVRSPFMSSGEQATALAEVDPEANDLNPHSDEVRARSLAAGYQVRWRAVASALSDLDLARVESEAMWGVDAAGCFVDLRKCAGELNAALAMYLRREREADRYAPPTDLDEQQFRVVYGGGDADEFGDRVKSAVGVVEAFFRPKLK